VRGSYQTCKYRRVDRSICSCILPALGQTSYHSDEALRDTALIPLCVYTPFWGDQTDACRRLQNFLLNEASVSHGVIVHVVCTCDCLVIRTPPKYLSAFRTTAGKIKDNDRKKLQNQHCYFAQPPGRLLLPISPSAFIHCLGNYRYLFSRFLPCALSIFLEYIPKIKYSYQKYSKT